MRPLRLVLISLICLAAAGCGKGGGTAASSPTATQRPAIASTGVLAITAPQPGDTVKGSTLKVRMTLTGARIIPASTKELKPDEGHVHVLLDGRLIDQTASLAMDIPGLAPGSHTLRVEFVAGDHVPFSPRVVKETFFTVTA